MCALPYTLNKEADTRDGISFSFSVYFLILVFPANAIPAIPRADTKIMRILGRALAVSSVDALLVSPRTAALSVDAVPAGVTAVASGALSLVSPRTAAFALAAV